MTGLRQAANDNGGYPPPRAGSSALPSSLRDLALFLDLDGTLLDIAPSPAAVVVPPRLPELLHRLRVRLGGALAIVTGRTIASADRLLAPTTLPVAGVHGAEVRFPDGRMAIASRPPEFDAFVNEIQRLLQEHPRLFFEDKRTALAIHYRADRSALPRIEALLQDLAATDSHRFALQAGKMALELRLAATDKGRALTELGAHPVFRDRRPLVIGDDLADETMFLAAAVHRGVTVHVGAVAQRTVGEFLLPDAAAVRSYLASLLGAGA